MAVRTVNARIVILTKEPIPGRVKTRLIPALGPDGAAALHTALVWETIERAEQSGLPVDVSLAGDLDGTFADQLRNHGLQVEAQVDGDLGARMAHALRGPGRRIALGTDCVVFEPAWLHTAARAQEPVVIGPASDGGYWLIATDDATEGLFAALFQNMTWSVSNVLDVTKARLEQAGHCIAWLPTAYDVDEPGDLVRLQQDAHCPAQIQALLDAISPTAR
jgi:rSAM/selenodomain-associated transferase 1